MKDSTAPPLPADFLFIFAIFHFSGRPRFSLALTAVFALFIFILLRHSFTRFFGIFYVFPRQPPRCHALPMLQAMSL